MLLSEQFIKQLSRCYYHGTPFDKLDMQYKRFDCFYLTTDILYALAYAKRDIGEIGNVYKFFIKKKLNIFNIDSDFDSYKLEKEADSDLFKFAHTLNWYIIEEKRSSLIKLIKSLGYDGFFNWESARQLENPGIGIFNIDDFINNGVMSKDEIFKNKKIIRQRNSEINNLQNYYTAIKKSGIEDIELIADIIFLDNTVTLSKKEILDVLKTCKLEESIIIKKDITGKPYIDTKIRKQFVFNDKTFQKLKEQNLI